MQDGVFDSYPVLTYTPYMLTLTFISPAAIRDKLALSQREFSILLGISVRTIQEWEQGRSVPSGPALVLLRIADQHPQVFKELK